MGEEPAPAGGDGRRDGRLVAQARLALLGTRACLTFGARGPVQGVGPAREPLHPLLVRTGLEPRLHLGLPGVGPVGGQAVAHGGVRLLIGRCLLGDGEPLGQLLRLRDGTVEGVLRLGRRRGAALGLARRAPRLPGERPEPLGDGRLLPVGGPAPLPQLLHQRGGLPASLRRSALGFGQFLAAHGELFELGRGLVDGGPHFQQARRPRGAAVREVRPQQVALRGDGGQLGAGVDEILRVLQGPDGDHAAQQPPHRRHQLLGTAYEVGDVGRALAPLLAHVLRSTAEQQRRAPRVLLAQQPDGLGGGAGTAHGQGVGPGTERRGDLHLMAWRDVQEFGGRAEQTREPVRGRQQGPGAVLAPQAERERLVPGGDRGPLALGGGRRLPCRGEGGLGLREVPPGRVVPFAEFRVVRVQAVDLGLELLVRLLGGDRALGRRVTRLGEAADLGLGGGGPRARRVDLSAEPREALPAVGDGPCHVLEPALLDREPLFEVGPVGHRVVEGVLGGFECRFQLGLLLPDAGGLALHVLGVPAAPLLGRRGGGALDPGVGQRDGAADPLGELRQFVPGLLGALQTRDEAPYLLLKAGLALEGRPQLRLGGVLALLEGGLVGDLGVQCLAQLHEVVGEQPQAGVAQVGLDDGGAAGHGGLAAEGLELAPQLIGEVLHAREVGLHRVELAQGLLLALAVLEDARGLLDEGAAAHGVGVQDPVELALADDDVHLAADAGVGEQFLDVEEAAGVAVDLVLAAAVAEHDPRDRDLGVLDGQRAVGVVDGEGDLGAAERRPPGGAGEDDVLHLAAAQRFGALFAHDPAQRVHDIGLARAVGSDDAGDARLELQGRRRRERLEATQGQGLEMHAVGLYLSPPVSPMKVQGTSDGKGSGPPGGTGFNGARKKGRRSVPCKSGSRRLTGLPDHMLTERLPSSAKALCERAQIGVR
ncbi:hypothetical protein SALBM135S_07494 [Streptomyces alboniger]